MKTIKIMQKPLLMSVLAIGILCARTALAEDVRLPTKQEFEHTLAEYEKIFNLNMSHVIFFYDENTLAHRGPLGAVRMEGLNKCGIIVNSKNLYTGYIRSFMKGAPSQDAARKFLVAHELTHCLFKGGDSIRNLSAIGIKANTEAHSQEVISDMIATAFLMENGTEFDGIYSWLKKKRSGHYLYPHYNTAQFLNIDSIKSLSDALVSRRAEFSFYGQSQLFKKHATEAIDGADRVAVHE